VRGLFLYLILGLPAAVTAGGKEGFGHMGEMHLDDPFLWLLRTHEFELRDVRGDAAFYWDAEAWAGKDLDKLWLKTEGAREGDDFPEAEVQLLYSRAVTAFWDLQAGWRRELGGGPDRDWAAIALRGTAPGFLDVDASLFLGTAGRVALHLRAAYDLLLTQRLIVAPSLELDVHARDDERRAIGSGIPRLVAGIRLRYEIRREFAPYIGISWMQHFGETADLVRRRGEPADDLQAVAGVRFWF
jgi:copper resistance protein B